MTVSLSLYEDRLSASHSLAWPAAVRGIYVRSGQVRMASGNDTTEMTQGQCRLFTQSLSLSGDAEIWTFEVSAQSVASLSKQADLRLILSHDIDLNATKPLVLRCDHVAFPPSIETPKHGHKAAGIRRLVTGRLIAEIGNESRRIDAGEAWYESGHEPVVGRTLAADSAFVRAMVLPTRLHGKPTFVAWDETAAAQPRGTTRTQFFDTIIQL
jgi:hypothetical protein